MTKELDILRNKIDKIDQDLLMLLSKRLSLVSEVGEIKSRCGLFIHVPEREEMIISHRRKEAIKLGISPNLVEDILRRIIRESYYYEHSKGFKKLCPNLRSVVIIGGKGHMGRLFYKMLTLSGYQVQVLDQGDWIKAESIFKNVGLIFISVPIHIVSEVIHQLPPVPDDCIVVDLSSLKKDSVKTILEIHTGPVLGLHPMFNPDIGNMIKQVVICCEGRYPDSYQWLLKQMQLWGAKLYYCSLEEHDKYMSFAQGLYHFITFVTGYHLCQENIDINKFLSFSSPKFKLELIMIGRLFAQNPQLYADIIMDSKNNIILIKRYYKRLKKILNLLEKNDKQEFINQFIKIRHWLGIYANLFFKDSFKFFQKIDDIKSNVVINKS